MSAMSDGQRDATTRLTLCARIHAHCMPIREHGMRECQGRWGVDLLDTAGRVLERAPTAIGEIGAKAYNARMLISTQRAWNRERDALILHGWSQ